MTKAEHSPLHLEAKSQQLSQAALRDIAEGHDHTAEVLLIQALFPGLPAWNLNNNTDYLEKQVNNAQVGVDLLFSKKSQITPETKLILSWFQNPTHQKLQQTVTKHGLFYVNTAESGFTANEPLLTGRQMLATLAELTRLSWYPGPVGHTPTQKPKKQGVSYQQLIGQADSLAPHSPASHPVYWPTRRQPEDVKQELLRLIGTTQKRLMKDQDVSPWDHLKAMQFFKTSYLLYQHTFETNNSAQ